MKKENSTSDGTALVGCVDDDSGSHDSLGVTGGRRYDPDSDKRRNGYDF